MEITRGMFEAQRTRRFGASNPERMKLEFWEAMVRNEEGVPTTRGDERDAAELGSYPYQVRAYFGMEDDYSVPVWTFNRMGATSTPHPDGRLICIGGEHEDSGDPDFCIYNDVVIIDVDGTIEIYGYPRDVFPPTDFHTASLDLDRNRVIVIGSIGYEEERRPGATPVFALSLSDYHIEPLPSLGEAPGWIFKHEAEFADGVVTIRGGEIQDQKAGEARIRHNFDDFAYDVAAGVWTRLTDRKWRQYTIHEAGGRIFIKGPSKDCRVPGGASWECEPAPPLELDDIFVYVSPEVLYPRGIAYETEWNDDEPSEDARFVVAGIPVAVSFTALGIELIVEGDMDEALADALAEDVRGNIEADIGRRCILTKHS